MLEYIQIKLRETSAKVFSCEFCEIFKSALSGLRPSLATKNPLKMMKNAFYFTLNALFVFAIIKFLS